MKQCHPLTRTFWLAVILTFSWLLPVQAAELNRAYDSLPDNTLLSVRIPDGNAFIETMRKNTKFGAVMLSDERLQRIVNEIKLNAGDDWDQLVEQMQEQGLEENDWKQLFAGEVGYALIPDVREGERFQLMVGLLWCEPGAEASARYLKAIAQGVEKQKDSQFPPTKVDIELAGTPVMHITMPLTASDFQDDVPIPPADFENMEPEEIEAWFKEQAEKQEQGGAQRLTGYTNIFIADLDGRLVLAHTIPFEETDHFGLEEDEVDVRQIAGVEPAMMAFASFIESQKNEAKKQFSNRMTQLPGLAEALPKGVVGLDLNFDFTLLMKLIRQSDNDPMTDQFIKSMGFDSLGALAMQLTIDGTAMRQSMYVQMPAPRTGLMTAIFDQPAFEPKPAPWVGNHVTSFTQISLDAGKLYNAIKQVILETAGPDGMMMVQFMEMQFTEMFQADIATALSALGQNHYFVEFLPAEVAPDDAVEDDAFDMPDFPNRFAVVWEMKDMTIWQNLFNWMDKQYEMAGDESVEKIQELGFRGYQSDTGFFESGFFIGNNFMSFNVGSGITQQVLGMLGNPPNRDASFAGSQVFEHSKEVLPPKPSILYSLADFNQAVGAAFEHIRDIFTTDMHMDEDEVAVMRIVELMIPTQEESKKMFGVGVTQIYVSENGLVYESATELPAPETENASE